jgi:ABC-type uncharacterized transport system permease subunit
MPASFCRYPILGAGMHHIIIALSAVAVVALTYMLQEFRRRLRVAGNHGAAYSAMNKHATREKTARLLAKP